MYTGGLKVECHDLCNLFYNISANHNEIPHCVFKDGCNKKQKWKTDVGSGLSSFSPTSCLANPAPCQLLALLTTATLESSNAEVTGFQ